MPSEGTRDLAVVNKTRYKFLCTAHRGSFINPVLALFGGYGLKGGNLLLHITALALWALEFSLLIFRHCYSEGKRFIVFFTDELIHGHGKPPL
jgi:hypothetical protein